MNWLASLHPHCPHFQSIARSWLFASRGWPFSRPSLAVTSASTTSVTTPRTASWATLCMWHWTCCKIVFRSSSCSFPCLNCILIVLRTPCGIYVFFTLPHGDTLQTPFDPSFPLPASPLEMDTVSIETKKIRTRHVGNVIMQYYVHILSPRAPHTLVLKASGLLSAVRDWALVVSQPIAH